MVYKRNAALLRKYHMELFQKIKKHKDKRGWRYEVICSSSSLPILRVTTDSESFYLHSKYDPVREAERLIQEYYGNEESLYVIYGFGFAYHIQALMKKGKNLQIWVLETNVQVFKAALKNIDMEEILQYPNLKIILEDDVAAFAQKVHEILRLGPEKLIIHTPSLKSMPYQFCKIKYLLEDYRVQDNTIHRQGSILTYNFKENTLRNHKNVDILFDRFENIPIFIVAAGPSLDKNKHVLKQVKNKGIIFSVGTAVKPLLNAGVSPDIIMITDPQDIVNNQIEGLQIDVPMIVLSTCSHRVMKEYPGPKLIALQQGYHEAEAYAREHKNQLVKTGGSVSTTALDVAIRLGCNPIVFVGLDLAYTSGKTHAQGTYFCKEAIKSSNLRAIPGNNEASVYTSQNLYIYLKWIEKRIMEESSIRFINATEGGAYLEGAVHMELQQVIDRELQDKESNNIGEMLKELVKNG